MRLPWEDRSTLLRLLIAENVLSVGDDPLDNAKVVIVQGGFSDENGEIKNANRKKYELLMFRQFFPKYTLSDKDAKHVRSSEGGKSDVSSLGAGRAHRFRYGYEGKMAGGEHGSLIHHANYTVIVDPTAPFGVRHIWETDSVTIEDSGPVDQTDEFCDGGSLFRGNSQIVLIEHGIGAVSQLDRLAEQSHAPEPPAGPDSSGKSSPPSR